jgi:hypothetical protein
MFSPSKLLLSALSLSVFLLTGCGGSKDAKDTAARGVVTGKLSDGKSAFAFDESKLKMPKGTTGLPPGVNSAVEIIFHPTDKGEPIPAEVDSKAGTFVVKGKDGKGIPAGRYKISVTARFTMTPDDPDYFGGKFTPEKTQILRDVKPGEEVIIDVSKPTG